MLSSLEVEQVDWIGSRGVVSYWRGLSTYHELGLGPKAQWLRLSGSEEWFRQSRMCRGPAAVLMGLKEYS